VTPSVIGGLVAVAWLLAVASKSWSPRLSFSRAGWPGARVAGAVGPAASRVASCGPGRGG